MFNLSIAVNRWICNNCYAFFYKIRDVTSICIKCSERSIVSERANWFNSFCSHLFKKLNMLTIPSKRNIFLGCYLITIRSSIDVLYSWNGYIQMVVCHINSLFETIEYFFLILFIFIENKGVFLPM